eukprot:scaffold147702_cov33-Tisochrysis_lutea.AAC.2
MPTCNDKRATKSDGPASRSDLKEGEGGLATVTVRTPKTKDGHRTWTWMEDNHRTLKRAVEHECDF